MGALVAALLLLLAAAVAAMCAGAETGFYAHSRLRHRLGLERGDAAARRLERLFSRPDRFLATLLLALSLALELVTFCNHALLESFDALSASERATLGTLLTAPLLFVFSEALPKQAFLSRPCVLLQRCSWPLRLLAWLLAPVAWLVARLTTEIEKLAPGGAEHAAEPAAESGVESALVHGLSEGLLTNSEHGLAANVLRLGRLTVSDLAVPIDVLPCLERTAPPAEWAKALSGPSATRALVVDGASNAVTGMVHALDLALALEEGRDGASVEVGPLVRPLPSIPADQSVAAALGRLHGEGVAIALVDLGKGRPPGLLRVQDVVGELFGRA